MGKRISYLLIAFLLVVSNLIFAQTENPYLDFNPENLKNNKDYVKNFNPTNYSHKILYGCLRDIVDAARAQYAYCPPIKMDNIMLDSAATMQAEYQAYKEERTVENVAPYRTTEQRLKKYGLGTRGTELTSRAKATLGAEEYCYYDLCLEWVKQLLKNAKTAAVLLDRQYTYLGFGYAFDQYMKYAYASFVFANDRVFNEAKPLPFAKDLPYTKTKMGLQPFDSQLCRKCMSDKNVEMLTDILSVQDGKVYFVIDDAKLLKKVIGKEGDAIVLDFVQHSQYPCDGSNQVDQDRPNHGFMTKAVTFEQIMAKNQVSEKKSTKLYAPVADIPEELPEDADFDVNIILIKDGKYVCRDVIKKQIECKHADYKEKMFFLPDTTTIKAKGEWVPVAEEHTVEFRVPFDDKKLDYTFDDIRPYFPSMPEFDVLKVEIVANTSINYAADATQQKNLKRRAESISTALKNEFSDNTFPITIKYGDTWEEFKKDIVNHEVYYDLSLGTKQEAINLLRANGGILAKELDEEYLKKHRYALLKVYVKYNIDGDNEQKFAVDKFNKMVVTKNQGLAMAVQQYIMKQVANKNYDFRAVLQMEIPNKSAYQPFLINQCYLQNLVDGDITDKNAYAMRQAAALAPNNQIAQFNKVVADIAAGNSYTDAAEITTRQGEIDRLYSYNQLPQDQVNNLNLEFQFQVIDYLKSKPASVENNILLENTYAKIKAIRNPVLSSWQNAYKLASVFIKNKDYVYAFELMEPFALDAKVSNDFLFSFISLGAIREELYMSAIFTKAVARAAEKDAARLCALFDKLPVIIFDNKEVKEIICKSCNK